MKLKLFVFLLIGLPMVTFGQKYKVVSGNYSHLAGIQDFDIK